MKDDRNDHLNILAPRSMRPKFDYLHREVQDLAGVTPTQLHQERRAE